MVNTFLPFPDFRLSAKVLDYKRLGRQRVEAMIIINILTNATNKLGWKDHPAVLAWKDNVEALKLYHNIIVNEWVSRGYNNNMKLYDVNEKNLKMPWWFGTYAYHISHQSNLMRKDPVFYKDFFKLKEDEYDLPYIWPTHLKEEEKIKIRKEIMKITVYE
jgi:hypothetical protein